MRRAQDVFKQSRSKVCQIAEILFVHDTMAADLAFSFSAVRKQ